MKRLVAIGAVAVGLALASCGGDDEEATTSTAPSSGFEAPDAGATPPSAPTGLPPGFVECMAEQGYEIQSSADIHTAPPQVLQVCFGSSH